MATVSHSVLETKKGGTYVATELGPTVGALSNDAEDGLVATGLSGLELATLLGRHGVLCGDAGCGALGDVGVSERGCQRERRGMRLTEWGGGCVVWLEGGRGRGGEGYTVTDKQSPLIQ